MNLTPYIQRIEVFLKKIWQETSAWLGLLLRFRFRAPEWEFAETHRPDYIQGDIILLTWKASGARRCRLHVTNEEKTFTGQSGNFAYAAFTTHTITLTAYGLFTKSTLQKEVRVHADIQEIAIPNPGVKPPVPEASMVTFTIDDLGIIPHLHTPVNIALPAVSRVRPAIPNTNIGFHLSDREFGFAGTDSFIYAVQLEKIHNTINPAIDGTKIPLQGLAGELEKIKATNSMAEIQTIFDTHNIQKQ